MSMTAMIFSHSLARRDELAARYGRRGAERALYAVAARLIAGDYTN